MYLVDDASVWLRSKNYNLNVLTWATLRADLAATFRPVDHV